MLPCIGNTADPNVLARINREIEVSDDWFECVFVVSFDISWVFAETVA